MPEGKGTFMTEKTKRALRGAGFALLYGMIAGVGLGAFVFLFAFLTGGFNWVVACQWVQRFLFVVAPVGIILGGFGLMRSGKEYEGSDLGFTRDIEDSVNPHEDLRSVLTIPGIGWPTAIVIGSLGILVVATAFDFVFLKLLGL